MVERGNMTELKILNFKFKINWGFTLLELLIVISIIGILVAVGLASYSSAQQKARDSRRKSDIKAIQNAVEQYYADYSGIYPLVSGNNPVAGSTYLPAGVPIDPKGSSYSQQYLYTVDYLATPTTYCVCALLEKTGSGNANTPGANGVCSFTAGNYYCLSNLQ
jgi:prepilin-type N-terminal cleavage/methylation domain-containing protein